MSGWIALVWMLIVILIGLNVFAAGVVALLHIWSRGTRLRTQILSAGVASGLLTASPLFAMALGGEVTGEPMVLVIVTAVFSAMAAAASLPGAAIVARRLEGPGDAVRVFD
jgi:hypothetical protein